MAANPALIPFGTRLARVPGRVQGCRPDAAVSSSQAPPVLRTTGVMGTVIIPIFLDKEIGTERPRNFPKDTQLVSGSQVHNPGHSHHRGQALAPSHLCLLYLLK